MFIQAEGVTKTYQSGDVVTIGLNAADLSLAKGEIGVILGPSGSGKSTLMNILGGIDRSDVGRVVVGDTDICQLSDAQLTEYRRERIGFVFQFYNLIPHLTVQENIEVIGHISKLPLPIDEILQAVGLADKKDRFPRELSGGEQQRVAIARAVIKNPHVLLCDEITGALDYESSIQVLKLIQDINLRYGTTVLMITHNAAIAAMANRVYQFRSGSVTRSTTNDQPVSAEEIRW